MKEGKNTLKASKNRASQRKFMNRQSAREGEQAMNGIHDMGGMHGRQWPSR